MIYGSVCSGIEAATVAWHPLGWKPAWFSEIEPFPCAVLAHHYPETPNLGDMTKFNEWGNNEIDVLVGGTPCQSFSVAGLRKGLDDPRGNLMLTYLAIASKFRPRWLVWENVPGVLSSNGGRDFGTFLSGLGELGYGFAYRVLDAQYFGVAQRRRRVFVVGYFGDWRRAAAVLFECDSLSGNPAPRREARKVAPTIPSRSTGGGGLGTDFDCDGGLIEQPYKIANCLTARTAKGLNSTLDEGQTPILVHGTQDPCVSEKAFALGRNSGQENVVFSIQAGATRTNPASGPDGVGVQADLGYTLEARAEVQMVAFAQNTRDEVRLMGGDGQVAVALALRGRDGGATAEVGDDCAFSLRASTGGGDKPHVMAGMAVRRLTPRECERLQGFPDDYTAIPWRGKDASECPDGPRYKALGNSMAVPVMRWIGERISFIDLNLPPNHVK